MQITVHSILDMSVGLILVIFSLSIYYLAQKSKSVNIFAILSFLTGLWSTSLGVTDILSNIGSIFIVSFSIKISYFIGTIICSVFLIFSLTYPYNRKIGKLIFAILLVIQSLFLYLLFFTDLIIAQSIILENQNYPVWDYGELWFLFDIHFLICWILGIDLMYKKFKAARGTKEYRNLKFLLMSFIIGIIPVAMTTVILPRLGIFNYEWLSSISTLIWILIVSYSIFKYKLFNIKIITTQVIIFLIWLLMMLHMLFQANGIMMINEARMLLLSIIFGLIIIRNTLHNLKQDKKIEELSSELTKAYSQLKELSDR